VHTDLSAWAACRSELGAYLDRLDALEPPAALRRLARLARFLLDRADAASLGPRPGPESSRKRLKRTISAPAPEPAPALAPDVPVVPLPLPPLATTSFDYLLPQTWATDEWTFPGPVPTPAFSSAGIDPLIGSALGTLAGPDFGADPLAFLKGVDAAWLANESSELPLDDDWLRALGAP
jgi:hypothetical protein